MKPLSERDENDINIVPLISIALGRRNEATL